MIEEENNLFVLLHDNEVWVKQLQEMLSRSSLPRGPTRSATSSMLSGPPHDVYLVSF